MLALAFSPCLLVLLSAQPFNVLAVFRVSVINPSLDVVQPFREPPRFTREEKTVHLNVQELGGAIGGNLFGKSLKEINQFGRRQSFNRTASPNPGPPGF